MNELQIILKKLDKLDVLEEKFDGLEKKFENLEERFGGLEKQVSDIKMTLENETNRNIKVIAEAHLDLSRKLDAALKVENEKEMLIIRVNHLENEVQKIKEKLEEIA